jgi:ATP-dependent DNA helicase RecQ
MPSSRGKRAPRALLHPLQRTLRTIFNLEDFRPGQQAVIESILAGRNTLAIMPTGAGKSLCYQLPALHLHGMTLVVSPLISLMKDQVDKLQHLGVDASQLNSALTTREQSDTLSAIDANRPEFLLTTPERLSDPAFLERLRDTTIDLLVIDEAHCISQWGHDFRPSYLELGRVIQQLGRPPVLALTATASAEVAEDIARQLQLTDLNVLNTGIYRPNLRYAVQPAATDDEKQAQLVQTLSETNGSAIVYTSTVRHAEAVTTLLQSVGRRASRYHGRVPAKERTDTQDRFMRNELDIIVATNAFGMGVDKPDIRLVVHYNMPGSLDAYYQESGRAGRDGDAARCLLLYQREDRRTHLFFLGGRYPGFHDIQTVHTAMGRLRAHEEPVGVRAICAASAGVPTSKVRVILALLKECGVVREHRHVRFRLARPDLDESGLEQITRHYESRDERDREKLDRMVSYAQSALCRWHILAGYFEEQANVERCGTCDNCQHPIEPPVAPPAESALMLPPEEHTQTLCPGDLVRVPVHGIGEVETVQGDVLVVAFANGRVSKFKRAYLEPA